MKTLRDRVITEIEAQGYVNWRYDVGQRTGELSNRWDRGRDTITLYGCMFEYRRDGELLYRGDMVEILR